MQRLLKKVGLLRNGGNVKRWHTKPIIGENTVGHHSFGALSLLLLLHPEPTLTLIKAIAWHDMGESEMGDVPSPALWADPEYNAAYTAGEQKVLDRIGVRMGLLSREEQAWLVGVDKLDAFLFVREQIALGNHNMYATYNLLLDWFAQKMELPREITALVDELREIGCPTDISKLPG